MARTFGNSGLNAGQESQEVLTFQVSGDRVELPSTDFIADAKMTRDGDDLVLQTPNGEVAVVEGYFSADPAPLLTSPDGAVLTPSLVDSFALSPSEFAAKDTTSDESPVGAVEEVKGHATVTRADGTVETITIGTPIYQGDIIETDAQGAVNISFIDETSMAISENARLAVDQYTFDPATESGTTNLSVLRGLFVFTSGLIGRDDPDDVRIDTPVGSIGIRGTIIAGQIDPSGESNITVLEGAIVISNGMEQTTLSQQFETVRLSGFDKPMEALGVVPANDISARFGAVSAVLPTLFTTIDDSAAEQPAPSHTPQTQIEQPGPMSTQPSQDSSPVAQDPSAPTSSNTAPVSSEPVVMTSMDLSGNTEKMGMPTMETMMGEPMINSSGAMQGSNMFTSSTTTAMTQPMDAAPVTSPIVTTPVSVIDPVITAPVGTTPPPVPPPIIVSPLPPTPVLSFTPTAFNDIAVSGTIVGKIRTGVTGATYNLGAGINDYILVDDGMGGRNVELTSTGATKLASTLGTATLDTLVVTASVAGQPLNGTYTTTAVDANATRTFDVDTGAPGVSVITDGSAMFGAGYAISALGDYNNDGFDDFVFSNNINDVTQNHSYIFYGGTTLAANATIPSLAGTRIAINPNVGTGQNYSESVVSGIGDFNGDHKEDYVIGQGLSGPNGGGQASIVNGNNTSQALVANGPVLGQRGYSVSGVGDINNDGFADVVIGQPGSDETLLWQGFNVTGWGAAPNQVTQSISANSTFGSSVSGVGDFNGDGYNDFMVGAHGTASNTGTAYLYKGTAAGGFSAQGSVTGVSSGDHFGTEVGGLGDINGDGYSDVIVAGGYGTNIAKIYLGNPTGLSTSININIPTGNYTINGGAGIGDFNGDGYDDTVISLADSTENHAFVVFGKSTLPGMVDLNYLKNPANAVEFTTNKATSADLLEISKVGDVNGDGYDDFAMGAYDVNGSTTGNGGMSVIYGRQTATPSSTQHVSTSTIPNFTDGGQSGHSFRGDKGNNIFSISNTNFLSIDGGGNNGDTIRSTGSYLDFSGVNYEKISGIENIAFGANNQTIMLTMENLFNLMKTSDDGVLKIGTGSFTGTTLLLSDGLAGDAIPGANTAADVNSHIDNYTSGSSSVDSSSGTHHTFNIGGYTLMIDQNITVDAQ